MYVCICMAFCLTTPTLLRALLALLQLLLPFLRFNTDPSIDLLLLTTHVGGLGLSLTGADTVIFIEHDWNPTKDLQVRRKSYPSQ